MRRVVRGTVRPAIAFHPCSPDSLNPWQFTNSVRPYTRKPQTSKLRRRCRFGTELDTIRVEVAAGICGRTAPGARARMTSVGRDDSIKRSIASRARYLTLDRVE